MDELLSREGLSEREIFAFQRATLETAALRESVRSRAHALQWKVLAALQKAGLSEMHLAGSTGYGYGDQGRDLLDQVYADIFGCESALVRVQFVSGTHAIACAMLGNLRSGQELLSLCGTPYDTLRTVIGISGESPGSLKDMGISYRQVELLPNGGLDLQAIGENVTASTGMVLLQRSRGYAWRASLSVQQLGEAISVVRGCNPQTIILVDNCYGELVEDREPTHLGADLVAGSLIKNLGGTLAAAGGYVAGKAGYVEAAACRLTAPGIGAEQGASLGQTRLMLQGLFLAPVVVGHAVEGAIWAAHFLEQMGLQTSPRWSEGRACLVQAIQLGSPEAQSAFCKGVQSSGPVDSKATPESWVQPGYQDRILMAGGTFVAGSSLELSADCPVRPPYIAYLQGGSVLVTCSWALCGAGKAFKNSPTKAGGPLGLKKFQILQPPSSLTQKVGSWGGETRVNGALTCSAGVKG